MTATVPGIAAGPAVQAPRRIGRILLATDLSPASEGASDQAILLARDLRADLLVVSVIDGHGPAHGTTQLGGSEIPPLRMDQKRASREQAAQGVVVRGQREGVSVTFLVWEGEPGPAIVEAADAEHVDMIVVGTRGRNRVERAVLGSVSDHVIRHAHCPVLIVRA